MSDERVLIIEDNEHVASALRRILEEQDFRVDWVSDGDTGLDSVLTGDYDIIVLDRRMPGIDGVELVRTVREHKDHTPVLMLTGRSGVTDRVEGLDAGADDYLPKPFVVEEFVARIQALLRRSAPGDDAATLDVNDLHMDLAGRDVDRAGEPIDLSQREFDLLELLMRHPGQVMSRARLHAGAWHGDTAARSNIVDVSIGSLRDKIDRPFATDSIETVRGLGYRLRNGPEPADQRGTSDRQRP